MVKRQRRDDYESSRPYISQRKERDHPREIPERKNYFQDHEVLKIREDSREKRYRTLAHDLYSETKSIVENPENLDDIYFKDLKKYLKYSKKDEKYVVKIFERLFQNFKYVICSKREDTVLQLAMQHVPDLLMKNLGDIFGKYTRIERKYIDRLNSLIDQHYDENKPTLSQMKKMEEVRAKIESKIKPCLKANFEV